MTKKNNNRRIQKGKGPMDSKSMNRSNTVRATIPFGNAGVGGTKPILQGQNRRLLTSTPNGIRVRFQDVVSYLTAPISGISKSRVSVGGMFTPFPWLATIATSYSKYKVHSLRMGFASNCPTTTSGDTSIAWVPDVTDANNWFSSGTTEAIFSFSEFATGPTWAGSSVNTPDAAICVTIPGNRIHNAMPWFYTGAGTGTADNTRYAGAFVVQVSSTGLAAVTNAGRLFIEYDIEFTQPTNSSLNSLMLESRLLSSLSERETRTFPDACAPGSVCSLPPSPPSPKPQ